MNAFGRYHPAVNFLYFVFVIGFSMFFMHPVCLAISLLCGFTYSLILKGRKAIRTNLLYMLPLLVATALLNPLFSHEGMTVLGYFPNGNPLTLESVLYGIAAGGMIISVICWFSCYNEIMTSDKFICLFGKVIPTLSLIFSMTLRFVPRFIAQIKKVTNAQRCIGCDISKGSIIKRAKNGIRILSAMITWALENAVETADSMKSRGYGYPGRTAYSIYTFTKRDKKALLIITALGLYILSGGISGGISFAYFPEVKGATPALYGISIFAAYLLLCICPVIIELWEVRRWKASERKI